MILIQVTFRVYNTDTQKTIYFAIFTLLLSTQYFGIICNEQKIKRMTCQ